MAKKNILTQSKKKKAMELAQNGQFPEARKLLDEVCRIDRVDAESWFILGIVNGKLGDVEGSIASLRQAVKLNPGNALAYFNLGTILREQSRLDEAIKAFQEAARLAPQQLEAQAALGSMLLSVGRLEESANAYRNLTRLKPSDAEAFAQLGGVTQVLGNLAEATACYRRVLQLDPGYARVHDNLGCVLCDQGLYGEAIASHRRALQITPNEVAVHSNLLLTMQYLPEPDAGEIYAEHCNWAKIHAAALDEAQGYANSAEPNRRLRIGYVSSDFRAHSVAFFFEPLLANHDGGSVEIFCYSGVPRPDAVTQRLQGMAHYWRTIAGLPDEQVAQMIRTDGIDILVDLAGHTSGSRLRLFARKPAPVQVTWLGYPDTTGLDVMDYRLTDELADPAGREAWYTEKLLRLPGCFLCYKPLPEAPEVASLPALEKGYVTFGSFNNLPKINEKVIALWAELLRSIPSARLFIKSPPLTDAVTCERYYGLFEAQGISRERIELIGRTASQAEHLDLYKRLDIALDPFPYNGTTTTCEALWMGVPVITLAGERHSGRVGVSLLNAVGRPEWIAQTSEQYLAIARNLAQDVQGLATIRGSLRGQMAASPLCDGASFARKVEAAYREMWRTSQKTLHADIAPGVSNRPKDFASINDPDFFARFNNCLERYTKAAPDPDVLQEMRSLRHEVAQALLLTDTQSLERVYGGPLGKAHQSLMNSGLRDEPVTAEEQPFVDGVAQELALGLDLPGAYNRLLACMLYLKGYDVSLMPAHFRMPQWIAWNLLWFVFLHPWVFRQQEQIERYYAYVSGMLRLLHRTLLDTNNSAEENARLAQDIATPLVEIFSCAPLYFSDHNLKDECTWRAGVMRHLYQFVHRYEGLTVDYQFTPRSGRNKIRVGFLRYNFKPSSETFATLPVFEHLDRDKFEIVLYTMDLTGHPLERYCASRADRLVGMPTSFDQQLRMIRGDDLDILFVGTNVVAVSSQCSRLSLYRLARIQATSICSPATTGMRNVDCYIAGELALPPDNPQQDYTERLVTLPGSGICFSYGPSVPAVAAQTGRGQAGIPEQAVVYISGSNFFKLIPKVRELYANIIASVPGSVLVMYPFNPNWTDSYPASTAVSLTNEMQAAFARHGVEQERLIILQPRENFAEIQAILQSADVYLDSFPYSGATSIADALQAHLPPVVMDGRYLRFKQAAAILRELDLSDLVAAGEEEYLELAVGLGRNPSLRKQVVGRIRTNLSKPGNFLDSRSFSQHMGRVFEELHAGHRAGS